MAARLAFLVCARYAGEVRAALAAEGIGDAVVVPLPARCGRPPLNEAEIAAALAPYGDADVEIVGSVCLSQIKQFIMNDDHQSLINYSKQGKSFQLSIPTPEHFLPLLYILALKEKNDQISFFNDKTVAGSLSMMCVKISEK